VRISCTLIDQWLYFQRNEDAQEKRLIESIKGVFEPSRPMLCGMAFDAILQEPEKYRDGEFYRYTEDCNPPVIFPAGPIDERCLPLFQEPGIWQPKETKTVEVEGEKVTVVTKVDRLVANRVDEVKTYYSSFDYDKYADAHQWRWYALNFEASAVRYSCFGFYENAKGEMKLGDIHQFTLYPYVGMEQECLEKLGELVSYIKRKGLEQYVADDRPRKERRVA
jgi:hypothetical protein